MSMTITEETIESFFNLIRNWDADAKRRLMNRISASLGESSFSENELWACINEMECDTQIDALLNDVRKN